MPHEIRSHTEYHSSINAVYCNFIGCTAENGGAIFTNYDDKHLIKQCIFFDCNATVTSESRGGAIHIKAGDCELSNICTDSCNGRHCSDIIFWTPNTVKCFLIQSHKSSAEAHAFFVAATKAAEVRNSNTTHTRITKSNWDYGGGIMFGIFPKTSFICVANIQGHTSPFCLYFIANINGEINLFQAYNNSNQNPLVMTVGCSSINIEVKNSSFIGNNNSEATSNPTMISFTSCIFSFPSSSASSNMKSCTFFAVMNVKSIPKYKCYVETHHYKVKTNHPLIFVPFISIFCMS